MRQRLRSSTLSAGNLFDRASVVCLEFVVLVKTTIQLNWRAMAALFGAVGAMTAGAVTTNTWVQNVNVTLVTAVQNTPQQVLHGSFVNKDILSLLSGRTNTGVVLSTVTNPPVVVTNNVQTNIMVEVTNAFVLPLGDSRSYVITDNYVVSSGGNNYTNNIDFTNDVVVTRTTATNATYTFNNAVTVGTNIAYLIPELAASSVTAVASTNGPGVFDISGTITEPVVSTNTTTTSTYLVNPDFTKLKANLYYITPVLDGQPQASKFVARYTSNKKVTTVDLSAFIQEGYSYSVGTTGGSTSFSEIYFNDNAGTSFYFDGLDVQTKSIVKVKNVSGVPLLMKTRKISGASYQGVLTGTFQLARFNSSTTIFSGSINITGGKME